MSTRAVILRENTNGTLNGIYCHFDGYPEHTGLFLQKYYKNREKVDALIELGSVEWLGKYLPKVDENDVYIASSNKNTTVPFAINKNYKKEQESYKNRTEAFDKCKDINYIYIFTNDGKWLFKRGL